MTPTSQSPEPEPEQEFEPEPEPEPEHEPEPEPREAVIQPQQPVIPPPQPKSGNAVNLPPNPVGIESFKIQDEAMTCSGFFNESISW